MILRLFILSIIFIEGSFGNTPIYSFSLCTTKNYEGAIDCKKKNYPYLQTDIFILYGGDLKYRTTFGKFDSYKDAKAFEAKLPLKIKTQKPFIQQFSLENEKSVEHYAQNKLTQEYSKSEHNITQPISIAEENTPLLQPTNDSPKIAKEEHPIIDEPKRPTKGTPSFQNLATPSIVIEKEHIDKYENENNGLLTKILDALYSLLGVESDDESKEESLLENKNLVVTKQIEEIKAEKVVQQELNITQPLKSIELSPVVVNIPTPKVIEKLPIVQVAPTQNKTIAKVINPPEIKPVVIHNNENKQMSQPNSFPLTLEQLNQYEKIIISVDSTLNRMHIKGRKKEVLIDLKEYVVSTARKNGKKPQGDGGITAITFSPTWYPTPATIEHFKTKGIELPTAVPAGHKYNYMGPAKIHLSHKVNGKNIYRIHGTLNESTIGSNESSGCIRMKNKEVLELAQLLSYFAKQKKMDNIKVILE